MFWPRRVIHESDSLYVFPIKGMCHSSFLRFSTARLETASGKRFVNKRKEYDSKSCSAKQVLA